MQHDKTTSSIGSLQINLNCQPEIIANVYCDENYENTTKINKNGLGNEKSFSTIQEESHVKPSFENLCQNQNIINISEYLNDEDLDTYAQREAEILEHSAGPKSGDVQSIARARSIR